MLGQTCVFLPLSRMCSSLVSVQNLFPYSQFLFNRIDVSSKKKSGTNKWTLPKIQDSLFLFLEDAAVPPTNNSSEQAIRMSTIFRKVTNGFRSDWGKDLFANVRSIINTGKRQGLSAFQAIKNALAPLGSIFS